jgi:hypothetical protein
MVDVFVKPDHWINCTLYNSTARSIVNNFFQAMSMILIFEPRPLAIVILLFATPK